MLRDTLGVVLYQEQVLETARALAGFTLGEGDELRRAMGSQRSKDKMRAIRARFIAGAATRGVSEATAEVIFSQIEGFASYSFPRSHATAFARLAYETAFLRRHHLIPFICARLNAQPGGFYSPSVIINDARHHGVRVLAPDLAASEYNCTIERIAEPARDTPARLAVRLGLRYVRSLADATGHALLAARDQGGPFVDLTDLCRRGHAVLTPNAVAALIMAGACDAWGLPGRQLLWALPTTWKNATGLPLLVAPVPLPAETLSEHVAAESWATGIPLTAHPIATIRSALDAVGVLPLAALAETKEGTIVTVAGLPIVAQQPPTAKGVVFLSLEDEIGIGSAILSATVARSQRAALFSAPILLATGRVQRRGAAINLLVQAIAPWAATGVDAPSDDAVQSA